MVTFDKPLIKELISSHNWAALREKMAPLSAWDIKELLLEMDKEERVLLFRALSRDVSSSVFAQMDWDDQQNLLFDLTDEETRHLLAGMKPDDRTALLEELPGQITQRLLNLLSPEDLKEARELLGYPEESVGRLMTKDYVAIKPDWTVKAAIEHVRKRGRETETINVIYVVQNDWKLVGALSLRKLVLAQPDEIIANIMTAPAVSLCAFMDREESLKTMERYGLFVLPVVDSDGIMVGIVTGDDVLQLATEEATEDFHKGAAIRPLKVNFGDAGFGLLYKSRIGWLMALVFVDLIAAGVISRFEDTISKVVALVFFMPLLIGCGGNAGSQASTLLIRDLATGDASYKDWLTLIAKEAGVSLALALTISLVVLGPSIIQGGIGVAIVVTLSGVVIITLSGVIGMAAPLILGKLGFDPAASSSPLITSIADIFGVLIYFSFATWFLKL